MSGFFNKAKQITGVGLDHDELYARAFEKGVLLNKFGDAADMFDKASKKFAENGDPANAARAAANSLLYRYLATHDVNALVPLLQILQGLPQIEQIGSRELMPVAPLAAELDCRLVEASIVGAQNDRARSRDLHKMARDRFDAIRRNPLTNSLITYSYVRADDGPNDRAEMRFYYHDGMFNFYEAMTKKDIDPSAASDDLVKANGSFKLCSYQKWELHTKKLLDEWLDSRTCWICHRDIQGKDLHFSMCHADVTQYTKEILRKAREDSETIDIAKQQIAVCTPCGSMITYKAEQEADKIRREFNTRIEELLNVIHILDNRVSHLERMAHHH